MKEKKRKNLEDLEKQIWGNASRNGSQTTELSAKEPGKIKKVRSETALELLATETHSPKQSESQCPTAAAVAFKVTLLHWHQQKLHVQTPRHDPHEASDWTWSCYSRKPNPSAPGLPAGNRSSNSAPPGTYLSFKYPKSASDWTNLNHIWNLNYKGIGR